MDRQNCDHRMFGAHGLGWVCDADHEPCTGHDLRPLESCDRMERTPIRDHFCPDCFSRGKYAKVYRDAHDYRGHHACDCGQQWPSLRAYLEDMRLMLVDLAADNRFELAQENQERAKLARVRCGMAAA